jgi:hypothetical protein
MPVTRAAATSSGSTRAPYRCSSVSSQAAKPSARAVLPARRGLAMPSSASATVTTESQSRALFRSIQAATAAGRGVRPGDPADSTLVSTRYTP